MQNKMKTRESFLISKSKNKESQKLYDALKKMRTDGESWNNIENRRVKLVPVREFLTEYGLVKIGNRIKLAILTEKDGIRAWTLKLGHIRKVQDKHILASVAEIYDHT